MSKPGTTRVLFVDDEPIILELIRLSIEPVKAEWEAAFAGCAEAGLKMMAVEPFDVVVSDLELPGMSGAEFLNTVMQRYPATLRIILSGHEDKETLLHAVGATHQFLSKPFKLSDLKSTLHRAHGLKQRLASNELQQLVGTKQSLPSIPDVYFQIIRVLQDPDCPVEKIGKVVATDPALTVKLLQLVNSAFVGFGREVANAEEAAMMLGTGTIRSLTLSMHLFSTFSGPQSRDPSLQELWNHSMRVGKLARQIVKAQGGDEKVREEAFTAGLLHDVGKLVLAENPRINYLELLAQARAQNCSLVEMERAAFQATHAEAGAYLLELWGLPVPLVEAVAGHHRPGGGEQAQFSPLTAVHVADALDREEGSSKGGPVALDMEYLTQVGVVEQLDNWRKERSFV